MKHNPIPVPAALLNILKKRWPNQQWKYVPGYETRYLVSNRGLVYHVAGDCLVRLLKGSNKAFSVKLTRNGIISNFAVHSVVALAFIPNDDPVFKSHIEHLNGDKMDNRVSNLAWVRKITITERLLEATRKQVLAGGHGLVCARYTLPQEVRDIRAWADMGVPLRAIAQETGKSLGTIRNIVRRDVYGNID